MSIRALQTEKSNMKMVMVMVINLCSAFSIDIFKCALKARDLWVRSFISIHRRRWQPLSDHTHKKGRYILWTINAKHLKCREQKQPIKRKTMKKNSKTLHDDLLVGGRVGEGVGFGGVMGGPIKKTKYYNTLLTILPKTTILTLLFTEL